MMRKSLMAKLRIKLLAGVLTLEHLKSIKCSVSKKYLCLFMSLNGKTQRKLHNYFPSSRFSIQETIKA